MVQATTQAVVGALKAAGMKVDGSRNGSFSVTKVGRSRGRVAVGYWVADGEGVEHHDAKITAAMGVLSARGFTVKAPQASGMSVTVS